METWIVTGVSGTDRIELISDLAGYCEKELGKQVLVYDVGELIRRECEMNKLRVCDSLILDVDRNLLRALRSSAMKDVMIQSQLNQRKDLLLIGCHATFRWKHRLIPGISYHDLHMIKPTGFVNVVRNVHEVFEKNMRNPKWDESTLPGMNDLQEWMIEEEFVTEVLAESLGVPMYIIARDHEISNLADLFFSKKKRVYLSYPISLIQESNPEMLQMIQGDILRQLQELFVVFNPMSIKDIEFSNSKAWEGVPNLMNQVTPSTKDLIKKRTIERDFQFIDQSDAVVVIYATDKVSPGVLAEVYYAHRTEVPVFMMFPYRLSPFMEDAAQCIEQEFEPLMAKLKDFAINNQQPKSPGPSLKQ